jgi:hypothetical protein
MYERRQSHNNETLLPRPLGLSWTIVPDVSDRSNHRYTTSGENFYPVLLVVGVVVTVVDGPVVTVVDGLVVTVVVVALVKVVEEGGNVEGGGFLVTVVVGEGRIVVDVTVDTVVGVDTGVVESTVVGIVFPQITAGFAWNGVSEGIVLGGEVVIVFHLVSTISEGWLDRITAAPAAKPKPKPTEIMIIPLIYLFIFLLNGFIDTVVPGRIALPNSGLQPDALLTKLKNHEAESQGFEPWRLFRTAVFKTAAIANSANSPKTVKPGIYSFYPSFGNMDICGSHITM